MAIFIISLECASFPEFPDNLKLHLTFNQPAYVPGDTAYFRGFLFKDNSLAYVPGISVVNIKLLDQNSKTILFNRVTFFEGVGINQITFPIDFPSGVYSLVAYSDEMMTANDPTSFFHTLIIIAAKKETRFSQDQNLADSTKINEKKKSNVHVELNIEHNYGVRSPVQLDIKIKNLTNPSCKSDFSISVYKAELFPTIPAKELFAFEKTTNSKESKLKSKKAVYFSGRAYFSLTKMAVPDSTLITFYLNRQMKVYGLRTKKGGQFDFPLFMALEDDIVFYAMEYKGKLLKDVKIDVADYSVELKDEIPENIGSALDPYTSFSFLKQTILGSFRYFSNRSKIQAPHAWDDEDFNVDYTVDLNKFTEFPTIEETLKEIVPLVKCREIDGKKDVRVFLYTAMFGKRSPLYIIDGMMTDSTEYFLGLDPSHLNSIGVMRSEGTLAKYGALGKNGILVVNTKGISDNSVPVSSTALSISGINKRYKFPAVEYSTESQRSSRIPDLRTALYWNPQVVTDQEGNAKVSFYTGDVTGLFRVQIEGLMNDGNSFSHHSLFNVTEKKP